MFDIVVLALKNHPKKESLKSFQHFFVLDTIVRFRVREKPRMKGLNFHSSSTLPFQNLSRMKSWREDFSKSSRPEVFCKKGVLRNFTKFTGKHLRQSLFSNKVAGILSSNSGSDVFL